MLSVAGLLLFGLSIRAVGGRSSGAAPELWYWHHSYNVSRDNAEKSRALIDKAAAAGYSGVAFWDSSFSYLGSDFWPVENEGFLRDVIRYAGKKGLKVIAAPSLYGYSNEVLEANPNWAESQRVTGAQFQVDSSGRRLHLKNSFPGLANSGFESGKRDWFSTGDAGLGVNTIGHSGKASAVIVDAPGNARLRQKFPLQPWRQYHLRLFYRSSNFRGSPMISLLDASDLAKVRLNATLQASGSHEWTQVDYTFNSQESTEGYLYLGVWGGSSGILWLDDISIEETALVYVTRRPGAPFKVYDPNNPNTIYREGVDFKPVADDRMVSTKRPFTDDYHDPTPVLLPNGTQLKPGQTVAMDFYAVFPVPNTHGVAMCLTEPAALKWVAQNARTMHRILPGGGGFLLGYDEIRQMNSCESCRAKHLSAGQLLAWNVGQTVKTYKSVAPESPLYIWNDMFDPKHNARNNYFNVEGDLAGSWTGVPSNVTVMNWNLEHLRESLLWFSGRDPNQPAAHPQIIAGYYDSGNGAAAAQQELQAAHGISGIVGIMYTTWNDDYSQLESFAAAAKAHWRQYTASVTN